MNMIGRDQPDRSRRVTDGPIFISYRRADEPFGAALVAAELLRRYGPDRIFLDTLALRPRSNPDRTLPSALEACSVVVAFVGSRWDTGRRLQRLHDETDWVRREVLTPCKPIVPVFFDRSTTLAEDVPAPLRAVMGQPVIIRRAQIGSGVDALVERLRGILAGEARSPGTVGDGLDEATITVGVDAMLRHVLPAAQQWSGNRQMIVTTTPKLLEQHDWLRHLVTAALPGRPNGSAVVAVTDDAVLVADLDARFAIARRMRVDLETVRAVDLHPYRRAWVRAAADIHLRTTRGPDLVLTGLFRREAHEMLENLPDRLRVPVQRT